MTPQELKNSILQLAIQGKLVPQRAEEGTAEELYNQIQAEKQKLIKASKIKKEKPLPEITDDEKLFEIPDSWKWVRLGSISFINGGYAFKSENFKQNGVRVIRISDFNETGFINTKIIRHTFDESLEPFLLKEKDIILCMTGGTVGKSYFVKRLEEQMITNQRVATIRSISVYQEYINVVVLSPVIQKIIKDSKNSTNDNISMGTITSFIVPLPPLAEQKRIVDKIEKMLPYVERYEKAYNKLQQLNKRFHDDLQKSVLQLAIQGRLVPQCPEEGTAEDLYKQIQAKRQNLIKAGKIKKEKPLPAITDDEKPFEIPDSWKWVRFGEVVHYNMGKTPPRAEDQWWGNDIPWISISDMKENGYIQTTKEKITQKAFAEKFNNQISLKGTLIMSFKLTVGRVSILDIDAVHNEAIISIYPYMESKNIMKNYFFKILPFIVNWGDSNNAIKGKTLNSKSINNLIFPLPPLAEQKRIVAKLEEILPLSDKLK